MKVVPQNVQMLRCVAGGCRQVEGALVAAKRTLELMRELVAIHRHDDSAALLQHVRDVGLRMIRAQPQRVRSILL